MSIPSPSPKYIPCKSFGDRYNVGTTKTYELVASGAIVAVKLGRKLLIEVASADAYFASLPRAELTTGLARTARRAA